MITPSEKSRQPISCPSFDSMIELLQSERYTWIVNEYGAMLEEDPRYLEFHHTSAALKLQFLLKDEVFPSLCIGDCIDEDTRECCVVTALREAIRRNAGAPREVG